MRVYIRALALGILFLLTLIFGVNTWVNKSTNHLLYKSEELIPTKNVGLLLGTSKYSRNGQINLFYKYRLEAATKLYKAGKINYILISGDNSTPNYDEPSTMKVDLIKMGIPEDSIFLDYAGFRTLDSIIRAKYVFGLSSFTVNFSTFS